MGQVFVGNVAFESTEDSMRDAFEENGFSVENVRLVKDASTGRSKGFGFVTFEGSADEAIDRMTGQNVDGRSIRVQHVKSSRS